MNLLATARVSSVFCCLILAQVVIWPGTAGAQEPPLVLNLFSPPVKPGKPVYVNAIFSNSSETQVFGVHQTLAFPREELVFLRARLGIAADSAGAVLTLAMQDESGAAVEKGEQAQRVDVTITAKKPISGGPLIEFEFRPADGKDGKEVKEGKEQSIRLRHVAEVLDRDGNKLEGLVFSDVHATITEDTGLTPLSVFSCFFYMH